MQSDHRPQIGVQLASPCMDCSRRYVGCHSDCAGYSAWKKAHAEANARHTAQMTASREAETTMHHRRSKRP